MSDTFAIRLSAISKYYRIYAHPQDRLKQMLWRGRRIFFREFEALKSVDLTVRRGQTVGIVGCNGSGKSTLLQIVCGTLAPTGGTREIHGRISALLELGAGFNPEFTGRENIYLNAAILGLSERETDARYEAIVAFSGLDALHLEQPVKSYSSGMYVRLAFAVAVAVEPDILVVDEALAVGDEAFQRKCFARIKEMQEKGTTILFVSHAAQTIIELCDHAVLMDHGEKLAEGEPKDVIAAYHRLIFSAPEKHESIRAALRSDGLNVTAMQDADDDQDATLSTESRVEYEPHGGTISDVRLMDISGRDVNVLKTGERYTFGYRVTYSEAIELPRYGMLLKTKRGLNLAGAVACEWAEQGRTPQAGESVEVRFAFDCHLRPGHYFLNCGATCQQDGQEIFVHRILDVMQCKVVDERSHQAIELSGNVDLNLQVTLSA